MKIKNFRTELLYYISSFLIPLLIMTFSGAIIGIAPFGDNSFLVSDINAQFAAFYTHFKHIILSDESFLFSLSKTLGGDMAGFSGYYLHNPFALILLLFPDEKILFKANKASDPDSRPR
ncbi:MAG: YfhO family protein [Lachnospiraceae bacterium]|nr:YfhO family protein [Lachnospiraceae bacterium]